MRTIETTLYKFSELDEDAKDRAREWYRSCADDDQWIWQEAVDSRRLFLREFNAELRHGRYNSESVHIPIDSWSNPIGKLSFVRLWKYLNANHADCISKIGDCQFTGVCYDESLLDGIAEFMLRPYRTDFESLLYSCCEDLRIAAEQEIEYRNSNEAVDESITCNQYEFTEEGDRA